MVAVRMDHAESFTRINLKVIDLKHYRTSFDHDELSGRVKIAIIDENVAQVPQMELKDGLFKTSGILNKVRERVNHILN